MAKCKELVIREDKETICGTRCCFSISGSKPATHCGEHIKKYLPHGVEPMNVNATFCAANCGKKSSTKCVVHDTPKNKYYCGDCYKELGYGKSGDVCDECYQISPTYGEVSFDNEGNIIRTKKGYFAGRPNVCCGCLDIVREYNPEKYDIEYKNHRDVSNPPCWECEKRATYSDPYLKETYAEYLYRKKIGREPVRGTEENDKQKPTHCIKHASIYAVDTYNKKCAFDKKKCKKQPVYNFPGEKSGKYCVNHKLPGMVDVYSKLCITCKLTRLPHERVRPSFNERGDVGNEYCSDHIPKTDENPLGKSLKEIRRENAKCCQKCLSPKARYGFIYDKKPSWCKDCKEPGAIDITTKKCGKCKNKRPIFGIESPTHCNKCKTDGMVDKVHKVCQVCKGGRANYAPDMSSSPTHCGGCAQEEIGYVDVSHKKCLDCHKRAYFNVRQDKRALYCEDHKKDDMIVVSTTPCEDCGLRASFNLPNEKKPLFCGNHKKDDMINTKPRCIIPHCENSGHNKYRKHCFPCFSLLYPEDVISKRCKAKEQIIVEEILNEFPTKKFKWILDKTIQGGQSKKRPDMFLDMGLYVIIVEIDENQHRGYSKECEDNRISHIITDAKKDTVFIRFNPDSYYDFTGFKTKSCWALNKRQDGLVIAHSMVSNWKHRLGVLMNTIGDWIKIGDNWKGKSLTEIKLFFDDM